MSRQVPLTVLLVTFCTAAHADPWIRMQTGNFELFTDAGERTGREILKQFERVHSFFELAYDSKKANAKTVCLIAFRSVKEYQAYRPNEFAAAYFQPGIERDYIVMTAGVTQDARVAVHEYTHLMIHQSNQRTPLWMNEGTAELFSTMEARGPKVLVGNVIPGHLIALARERWIGLDTLLNVDHASSLYNEKDHAGIFYAESWLLVHMLNLDTFYRPHLRDFNAALQEIGPAAAFQQVYRKSLAGVEDDLHQYFQRKNVNGLLVAVQLPQSADDPEIQPGAAFGIRLALAGLLSDAAKKRDQALKEYLALAHDYPDKWEVETGLAQYYRREHDNPEAAKHYARAVELGCKDPHDYVEYGKVLTFSRREKEAADVLRKAVELDSTNQQAHSELAIALTGAGEYQAALAEFKSVPHVTPAEASRYFYYFAFALYRDGKLPEARAVLERGNAYAANDQERSNYAALLHSLEARATAPAPGLVYRNETEGQLTRFDCNGKQAVVHLNVNGAEEIFVIEDPQKVMVRSAGSAGGKVDIHCGPQKNERLLVQYEETKDDAGKVTRFARVLEFR